ncbi:MAG: AAC(3) family N-acetyltransferase [Acidobacteria bacterium]|nr:MAG: AAC(3) family N-acetyltransferase [Acidobacteriota bacterium]
MTGAANLRGQLYDFRRRHGRSATSRKMARGIRALGVYSGDVVIAHTSLRKVGKVRGGPEALIKALRKAVGSKGTICMPAHSYGHEDPIFYSGPVPELSDVERMRAAVAPFDPRTSPTTGMGVVAETFRQLPGVRRSPMPLGIAALGPAAEYITATQSLDDPQGLESPVGRIYALGGKALLIGVKLDRDTTLHVAEALANTPWQRRGRVHLTSGWTDYTARLNCGNSFWRIEPVLHERGLITYGRVGRARSMCISVRDSVDLAAQLLMSEPGYFLCTVGTCHACDAARPRAQSGM